MLDRFDKRTILIVTSALGTLQALALMYLVYMHEVTILEVVVLALLMGIVNAIDGPGRNVIIKEAVEHPHNVRQASKMFTSLYNVAQVLGPGLAGFLILFLGYPGTFFLNGLSFVVLIVALVNMHMVRRELPAQDQTSKSVFAVLVHGARYVYAEPGVRLGVVMTGAICAFGLFYSSLLSVIARDMFHGGPLTYSYLAMSSGIGSLVGSFAVVNFHERVSHKRFVVGGMVILGVSQVVLSLLSLVPAAMCFLFFMGFGFIVSFSSLRSSIIHITKHELSGIVMGITFSFFYGGMVLGSFAGGYLATIYGCPAVLLAAGAVMVILGFTTPFLPGINELE
jgi:predicted MFS family arabinose efflux permease